MRIRDRTTAKESVVKKMNEVKQHGYEDSEKYIEATMRSQSSAQSSRRGETMKKTEKSKANNRQEKCKANSRQEKSKANSRQEKSTANGRQSKPKDCDRDEARYVDKCTVQSKAAATHPNSDADGQEEFIQSASQSQMFITGNTS